METSASSEQAPERGLFRDRDFRLLVAGQTASQLGSQVSAVAMSLVAVVTLHASSFEVGLIGAASTVAFVTVGLPAGAWCDRVRRRPVLVVSDVVRALALTSVPVAALLHVLTIGQLVLVALLTGVARVFFDVAYPSYLPSLVGRERVLAGNATLETIRATGQVAGPGLGGFLVGIFNAAGVLWIDVVSYLASAGSLALIRTPEAGPPPATTTQRMAQSIREGLGYVLRQPVLRATAAAGAMSNVAFAALGAVTFIFFVRDLHLSPGAIGVVMSVGALAAMLGAAAAPALARRLGSARVVWLVLALTAPFPFLVPLAQPGRRVVLLFAGNAVAEFGQIVYAVTNLSLRQRICPDHMLGRVNATMRVLIMGALPLGGLAGGALGGVLGIRATIWAVTPLLALAFVPLLPPLWRVREVTDLPAPEEVPVA